MTSRGRAEVARRRQRITALFKAINGADLSGELTSHYARYLCILVSGFVEQSVKELVTEYCRGRSSEPIQRYVGSQLKKLRNIDSEKLKQLVESYSVEWWRDISEKYPDQLESIGSIATVRNNVSHGGDAGITMSTIRQYFDDACVLMDRLSELFDPK
jgi:hypothetical protein